MEAIVGEDVAREQILGEEGEQLVLRQSVVAVAVGGAFGSVLRYYLALWVTQYAKIGGYFEPRALGVGYDVIGDLLNNRLAIEVAVALLAEVRGQRGL